MLRIRGRHRQFTNELRQRRLQRRFAARGVDFGKRVYVCAGTQISCPATFGTGTRVQGACVFKGDESVTVGKYCAIGDGVRVVTSNHEVNRANMQINLQRRLGFPPLIASRGPVTIGNNVWIGDAAILLSGVTVGDGSVIGAGSVVTRSVPPFSIAAGAPARVLRRRFDDQVVERLTTLSWWDWPEERIEANRELFEADLASDSALDVLSRVR